jgi:hypothetical protein
MRSYREQGYCGKCGEKLIAAREWKIGFFSTASGDEYVRRKVICPNKRWWWDGHEEHIESNDPNDLNWD